MSRSSFRIIGGGAEWVGAGFTQVINPKVRPTTISRLTQIVDRLKRPMTAGAIRAYAATDFDDDPYSMTESAIFPRELSNNLLARLANLRTHLLVREMDGRLSPDKAELLAQLDQLFERLRKPLRNETVERAGRYLEVAKAYLEQQPLADGQD